MSRHLHRCALRHPRTAAEAFKDMYYAAPIERPWPPLWKRVWTWFWRDFA